MFVSDLYGEDYHVETFTRLAGELAGHVDRIAISFLGACYARRVQRDLRGYERRPATRWPSCRSRSRLILLASFTV